LKNKEKRISIASNGRELVKEKYDWNLIGTNMANSIKAILSKNGK
jgi:hypothetical protein